MGKSVLVEKKGKVSIIKLNMEKKRNAFEKELRDDLKEALIGFRDDEESRVAILTGVGSAFCAGGSLEDMKAGIGPVKAVSHMEEHNDIILLMTNIPKPIIAAVNGAAVGAGWSLAIACDIIIASSNALFMQAFTKVGIAPDMGTLYFLPRLVGMHKAKELILTAKMLNAKEAYQMGAVNHVVNPEELDARSLEIAEKVAAGPGFAFAMGKSILNRSLESSLDDVLRYETYAQSLALQTEDHKEGLKAFYEKRNPEFHAR